MSQNQPLRLKERELSILKAIAAGPRRAHNFTHAAHGVADIQCAPHVIQTYLDRLGSLGLIAPPQRSDGKYAITDEGLELLAEIERQSNVTPGTLVCNSSMKETYRPPAWNVREGGDDHRQFFSRGIGA